MPSSVLVYEFCYPQKISRVAIATYKTYLAINKTCDFCNVITFSKLLASGNKGKDCFSFNKEKLSSIDSRFIFDDKFVAITATFTLTAYLICKEFALESHCMGVY